MAKMRCSTERGAALKSLHVSLIMLFVLATARLDSQADELTDDHNMLAYTVYNYDQGSSLMLYNPLTEVSTLIYENDDILRFQFSKNGTIALSSMWERDAEIFLLDTQAPDQQPVNLSQTLNLTGSPLGWSHDGRYLAFTSYEDADHRSIHVWDTELEISLNITPDNMHYPPYLYKVDWSPNGVLAFNLMDSIESNLSGDYIWDGTTTISLGENSTFGSVWSAYGELAFVSGTDDDYIISVWDGKSFDNGVPNRNTFITLPLSIHFVPFFSLNWTNREQLVFMAIPLQENHVQIFLWDGQTATNISQNPKHHNGSPTWNQYGEWAFVTFFSSEQLIYIRDAQNRTILKTEGQYSPAWSSDGMLLFCRRGISGGWVLSLWNREEVVEVSRGSEIWAQWQNGQGVVCTSG